MSITSMFSTENIPAWQEAQARKKEFEEKLANLSGGFADEGAAKRVLEKVFEVGERPDQVAAVEARYSVGEPMTIDDAIALLYSLFEDKSLTASDFLDVVNEFRTRRYARLFEGVERRSLPIRSASIRPIVDAGGSVTGFELATRWLGAGALWMNIDLIDEPRQSYLVSLQSFDDSDEWLDWPENREELRKGPSIFVNGPPSSDDDWIFPFDIERE
ncbi:MAG TPA: hypothetical protein VF194_04470 [Ferrovibrio sp.]|uniref:hypothetical protein n=1 Tax=Ferrovibrio sp. TaxID=1917215 RepID=UPI002ED1364B